MAEKKPLIKLTDLTKTYHSVGGDYQALKGINLEIHSGEFVAVMGPSGSGKSTLMHILGALDSPTSGTYMLKGKDISSYTNDQLSQIRNRLIGFVFQSFNLLPRTSVRANVEKPMIYAGLNKSERTKRAEEVLKLVGLKDKADNMSNHISGGQIQRVAIARALALEPPLILADEPTGNLDTKTANEIMDFFTKLNHEGNTIVVITHEPDIATYARRVITLRDGEIITDKQRQVK